MPATKRVLVLGHPLAAEENCLAFKNSKAITYTLCRPKTWHSRSLGFKYRTLDASDSDLVSLPVINPGRNTFFIWRGLASWLRQEPYHAVYCWAEPWSLAAFQCARLCAKQRTPFYFYSAENRPKPLPFPFRFTQSYCYRNATGAIAITSEVIKRLRQSKFQKPIYEIPLWIRPTPFRPADATANCLIYIGRLIQLKRVDLILKALSLLDGFRLKIIGDGPERVNLERLVNSLELDDRVTFKGVVANRFLPEEFIGCSLAVIPTNENLRQAEQFGKAAVEAAAAGLPVLTSRTGNYISLSNEIPTIHTGEFSHPTDLALKIRTIHEHFPKSAVLSESRARILQRYSSDAVAPLFHQVFVK